MAGGGLHQERLKLLLCIGSAPNTTEGESDTFLPGHAHRRGDRRYLVTSLSGPGSFSFSLRSRGTVLTTLGSHPDICRVKQVHGVRTSSTRSRRCIQVTPAQVTLREELEDDLACIPCTYTNVFFDSPWTVSYAFPRIDSDHARPIES
jgi:hypothetical protein